MDKVYICMPLRQIVMCYMFQEIEKVSNIKLLYNPWGINNRIKQWCYLVHHDKRINRRISLPGKNLWSKNINKSILLNEDLPDKEHFFVLVLNPSAEFITQELVHKLKNQYNCTWVLILFDPSSGNSQDALKRLEWFDMVYSFDMDDCKRYGFKYFFQCYSKIEISSGTTEYSDLYFTGWANKPGRKQQILQIAETAKANLISTNINLVSSRKTWNAPEVQYHKNPIPYTKVIEGVNNCNCILDVVQENQAGASLKYLEAIVYNRKLLSNNPNIRNFPYYDSRFMHIFDSSGEIDHDWIKSREQVEYGYQGDFSPIKLIKKIQDDYYCN